MNRPGAMGERIIALFALSVLLFNPPLISLFSADVSLFGLPMLYVYIFASWGAAIALIAYMVNRRNREPHDGGPEGHGD